MSSIENLLAETCTGKQAEGHFYAKISPAFSFGEEQVFGLFHAYQGWRNVVVIAVLGVLYDALAAWRGNLRINIVSHAWADIWESWLKVALLR